MSDQCTFQNLLLARILVLQQSVNGVVNRCSVRMVGVLFQTRKRILKCRFRYRHATILTVATQFDPFRFDQTPGPEPVEGPLPSVCLVDDNDDLDVGRPRWLRAFAAIVIAVFLGVTVLTAVRQVSQGLLTGSTNLVPRAPSTP